MQIENTETLLGLLTGRFIDAYGETQKEYVVKLKGLYNK